MRAPRAQLSGEEHRFREEEAREAAAPPRYRVGSLAWRRHVASLTADAGGGETPQDDLAP